MRLYHIQPVDQTGDKTGTFYKCKGFFFNVARTRLFIFFHVDVLRATTEFLAEVTAARRWRLAASFRNSTGLQTDLKWAG